MLGGTFDPVHHGHLVAAADVRHALDLDVVLLVVAYRPWQKEHRVIADAGTRLAMVEAAVADVDGLEASSAEIDRGGPTYTADTLRAFNEQMPGAELFLIVGEDVAGSLHTWERPDEVRDRCTLAVVGRPGSQFDGDVLHGWRWTGVEVPSLQISSSDIRSRVADGRPVDYLTHPAVVRLIRDRGLYAGQPTT